MRHPSSLKQFLLLDCNNFFVSCERVFNPRLMGKPVVVLSNNDGCIIARSNEAKALGIAMGAPFFECESIIKKHQVIVYSSNFALYGDMSARVMSTVAELASDIEIYSIDEAFLFVEGIRDLRAYGQHIRTIVKQRTGIPVSLGIASTKTLSKVANGLAKKRPEYAGVCDITDHPDVDTLLAGIPVGDVWGAGRQYTKLLTSVGISTAKDLKYAPDAWIRKKMTVNGLRTALELRGISCIDLMTENEPKKSITVSRSFGRVVSTKHELQEAVSSYMIRAAEKLRKEELLASLVTVFVVTSSYHDQRRYYDSLSFCCAVPTSYTPKLLDAATACLDGLYKYGSSYKKAGILLNDLVGAEQMQLNLFAPIPDLPKERAVMKVCDTITARWGQVLSYASAGTNRGWQAKRSKKSPHYTTSWHELFTLEI